MQTKVNLKCSIYSTLQYFKTYDKPDLTKTYNINNHINVIKLFLNHSPSFDSVPLQIKIFVHFYQESISKDYSPKKKFDPETRLINKETLRYHRTYRFICIYIYNLHKLRKQHVFERKENDCERFQQRTWCKFPIEAEKKKKRERKKEIALLTMRSVKFMRLDWLAQQTASILGRTR